MEYPKHYSYMECKQTSLRAFVNSNFPINNISYSDIPYLYYYNNITYKNILYNINSVHGKQARESEYFDI